MSTAGRADFSDADCWSGGDYEAAIVLGACGDPTADEQLRAAICAIWSLPILGKCVSNAQAEPSTQERVDPHLAPLEQIKGLYGWLQLEFAEPVPFSTSVVRETEECEGHDWLYAGIPIGGLLRSIPSVDGWPFGGFDGSQSWREPVEGVLAEIALAVSRKVPFLIAAIGYEIAGMVTDDEFKGIFPNPRRCGYVWSQHGGYEYLPTNDWT